MRDCYYTHFKDEEIENLKSYMQVFQIVRVWMVA